MCSVIYRNSFINTSAYKYLELFEQIASIKNQKFTVGKEFNDTGSVKKQKYRKTTRGSRKGSTDWRFFLKEPKKVHTQWVLAMSY